ncbi:MAG: HAD family hydrolase [Candidatus Hermodarchaeota archaeon]
MIHLVTFDLWNTIFTNKHYSDLRLDYFIEFLNDNQIPFSLKEVTNVFNSTFQVLDVNLEEIDYRHIYTHDRITRLLLALNIKISKSNCKEIKANFEKFMLKDPPPLKNGVKEALKELSESYKIGLISNIGISPGWVVKKVFKIIEIEKYFKLTLFSDETGFYKPKPIMFETALKKLKCKPQNAIHIGDRLETDIKGAKACNMLTIWLNDSNSPKSEEIQPDYEVDYIYDVVQIIKEIK